MVMKIKLKVKNLLLLSLGFLLLVFVLLPKGNIIIARALDRMDSPYAEAFYERYLDQNFGNPSFRAQLEYAETLIDGFNRYGIFSNHRGGVIDNRPEDLQRAKELLETGIEREKNLDDYEYYYLRGYRLLMDLYIATGEMKNFQQGLRFPTGESEELEELQRIYCSYYEIYFGDINRGKELLNEGRPAYYLRERRTLLGEIALREGKFEEARAHISEAEVHRPGKYNYFHGTLFGTGAFQHQNMWIDSYINSFAGNYTLSGQITFDGDPMSFVEIYIKKGGDNSWQSAGERMVAITDEEGYFETLGLRRGSYSLGIGIDSSRLYDKYLPGMTGPMAEAQLIVTEDQYLEIKFTPPIAFSEITNQQLSSEEEEFRLTWSPVPEAAYYEAYYLSFTNPQEKTGGHGERRLITAEGEDKIFENGASFTVGMINEKDPGGIVSFSDEERLLEPGGILSPTLPGVEYPLFIKAFDEDHREITSSLSLRGDYNEVPSFSLEGELSEGEQLLLDQAYPEAIAYYKEHIEDGEIRKEALRTLSLIYHYGWKKGEEDKDLALTYAEEYYNETGNSRILEMILGGMSLEEVKSNRSRLEYYIEKIGEPQDDYHIQQLRGDLHLIDGDWEEAVAVYEENQHYLNWKVLYLDLLLGDYVKAADRMEDSRFHIYRLDPLNMKDELQDLREGGLTSGDEARLKRMMEALLLESRDSAAEVYREIYPDIESEALRNILYEIRLMNNWDRVW